MLLIVNEDKCTLLIRYGASVMIVAVFLTGFNSFFMLYIKSKMGLSFPDFFYSI